MPSRALRIASFLGAPIYVTWSWLLFVAIIVPLYTQRLDGWLGSGTAIVVAISLALMWGVSVLLHELGHVAAARACGCEVDRVEIGFLGGATSVRDNDESPRREFIVAAAGPAVSLALGLPGGIGMLTGSGASLGLDGIPGMFVSALTLANLAIAAFNLLPGLPLDGGRIAVSGLWKATGDRLRASVLASYGGQAIAALLVAYVLWRVTTSAAPSREIPWVLAAAIMSASLWQMATSERRSAQRQATLASRPLVANLTPIDVLDGDLPASALAHASTPFVIVRMGGPLRVADRSAAGEAGTVGDVSSPLAEHRVLGESASQLDLLEVLRAYGDPWFVVIAADGTPLGITGAHVLSDR